MKFHFFHASAPHLFGSLERSEKLIPAIAFPFVFGVLCGTVIGSFGTHQSSFVLSDNLSTLISMSLGSPSAKWHSLQFLFLATLFATTILGVVLLPLLSAFRAYLLACSIAAMLHIQGYHGLLYAFFCLVIPAMLSVPAFLLAAQSAIAFSKRLLQLSCRDDVPFRDFSIIRRAIWIIVLSASEFVYRMILLPKILQALP